MLDESGHDLALVKADGPVVQPDIDEDVDYDVYEARSPIRTRRQAWLGIAGLLAFTILIGWTIQRFLDAPTGSVAARVRATAPAYVSTTPTEEPAPTPSATRSGTPRPLLVTVLEPATLGGRAKSTESKPEALDYLRTLTDGVVISGVYGDLDFRNFVIINAATSSYLLYPDLELDVLIGQLQLDDANLTELQPVPAGDLGGVARCGASKFSNLSKTVCVWAADQSVGVVTWIDSRLPDRDEFLTLRAEIEHLL